MLSSPPANDPRAGRVFAHSTEAMTSDSAPPKNDPDSAANRRLPIRVFGVFATVVILVYAVVRVNWLPIVTPDSLLYLDHSNDLIGVGLVQVGFRQFGYPLWLASVDSVAGILNIEPLALTVILQRLLLVLSAGLATYVLRWWATPIVFVLVLPTTVVYTNYILTEAISIPVAVIAAVACVGLFNARRGSLRTTWLVTASLAAAVLPMIRLHYGLLSVAIIAAIAAAARNDRSVRRSSAVAIIGIVISTGLLVVSLAIENKTENDIFLPSLGSERVLFASSWDSVVTHNRDAVAAAIPDVYLDGTPGAFIVKVDQSAMTFREKNAAYAAAVDQIFAVTGASLIEQRVLSFAGAFGAPRMDDLGPVVVWAARPTPATGSESFIHQYAAVAEIDAQTIAARYNNGTVPQPVLSVASRIPSIRSPYLGSVIDALLAIAIIGSLLLAQDRRPRPLAAIGLAVLLGYAIASSLYVMDNLRYLLPAYLFAIVLISGAASLRLIGRKDYSISSSTISLPRS